MTSSARKDLLHPSWEIFWDPGGLWARSRVRVAAAFVVSLWEGCTDGSVGRQRRGLSHSSTWSERPVARLGSLWQSPGLLCQSSFPRQSLRISPVVHGEPALPLICESLSRNGRLGQTAASAPRASLRWKFQGSFSQVPLTYEALHVLLGPDSSLSPLDTSVRLALAASPLVRPLSLGVSIGHRQPALAA